MVRPTSPPDGQPGAALRLRGVTKQYGTRTVLRAFDLDLAAGETVAVLGRNGAGKSTLLRVACGLSRPADGTVEVGGADPRREPERARAFLGALTQDAPVDDEMTAGEQLAWWLRLHRRDRTDANGWLDQAGLGPQRDRMARELSRGQRQRLAILLALAHDPPVAVLDEPFTALDAAGGRWLEGLLAHRRGRAATLLALHDEAQAMRLADRVVRLGPP